MNLYIKGEIQRLPHNLLTQQQLTKIYNSIQTQTLVQYRDKTILAIYINQGVLRKEIEQLQTSSINLEKGTITIEKNVKLVKRTLPLASYQVMQLHKYLTEIRPQLIQKSEGEKGQRLFFTLADNPRMHDSLILFLRTIKNQHPEFKNFQQIRSSVISHWIKEKPIREVQYLAGHNSITSTERYRQVDLKDLEESLQQYHPLK
jgi:integrase/recombinase XerD